MISSWIKTDRYRAAVPVALTMATLAVIAAAGLLYAGYPEAWPLGVTFLACAMLVILLFLQELRGSRRRGDMLAARAAGTAMEASLHALVEEMPAVIVIVDPAQAVISFINPVAAALIEGSPDHPEWRRHI